jgi:hypothetical protein
MSSSKLSATTEHLLSKPPQAIIWPLGANVQAITFK